MELEEYARTPPRNLCVDCGRESCPRVQITVYKIGGEVALVLGCSMLPERIRFGVYVEDPMQDTPRPWMAKRLGPEGTRYYEADLLPWDRRIGEPIDDWRRRTGRR
jgi:hypothetical protein